MIKTHPHNLDSLRRWIFILVDNNIQIIFDPIAPTETKLAPLATVDDLVYFKYLDEPCVRDVTGRDGRGFMNIRTLSGRQIRLPADTKVEILPNRERSHYLRGFSEYNIQIDLDATLPINRQVLTGRLSWLSNTYMTYAGGPANPSMSSSDYLEMCLYLGFVRKETRSCLIWYKDDVELLAPYLE
jgi:hypothetical protein